MFDIFAYYIQHFRSDQIRSVAQSCPTLCDPMNCSTPGLPIHHQLPELLSVFTFMHWRRKWQPTPVFLPGKTLGQRSWWATV